MLTREYKILLLEDSETDAELITRILHKSGMKFHIQRARNSADFTSGLKNFKPDLVLSDYNMPSFDGLSALRLTKEVSPDIPFIVVSGVIGDELAVEILKRGATDYLLKDRLTRLVSSIKRALKESIELIEKKKLEIEKLELQERVLRMQKMETVGTLATTIAHELRNPLAAIKVALFNIKRKTKGANIENHIASIDKKIFESNQIIDNLLFYSRIKTPEYQQVNLRNILNECIEITGGRLAKKISIQTENFELLSSLPVNADPVQMKELFGNILSNAFDAVPAQNGLIEIKPLQKNGSVLVCIKDNGGGIDKENIKRVFQPFFSTKAKGTGLGLAVCDYIMNLHKGKIEIESEKGVGTTVTLILPINSNQISCLK